MRCPSVPALSARELSRFAWMGPRSLSMSSEVPSASETVPEIPSLTKVERDALVLDFQRLAARLVQAKLLSASTSTRLMRSLNRERLAADDRQRKLAQLVLEVLLGLGDGTLTEGQHFVRLDDEHVALHLASLGTALFRAQRMALTSAELRSLVNFGWQHYRNVLVSRSGRARFGADDDRRRVVVLHEPSAREFVGARK